MFYTLLFLMMYLRDLYILVHKKLLYSFLNYIVLHHIDLTDDNLFYQFPTDNHKVVSNVLQL